MAASTCMTTFTLLAALVMMMMLFLAVWHGVENKSTFSTSSSLTLRGQRPTRALANVDIIINEIMRDSKPEDEEFVELYNKVDQDVVLNGWKIGSH